MSPTIPTTTTTASHERAAQVIHTFAVISVLVQAGLVITLHFPATAHVLRDFFGSHLLWVVGLLCLGLRHAATATASSGPPPHWIPGSHPYLAGNFAPNHEHWPLTQCAYDGQIPRELGGGQYVRNGGNPLFGDRLADDPRAHYHWFDGDGALAGVFFSRRSSGAIVPMFVHQPVLTDLYLHAKRTQHLRFPLIPSIALLVSPYANPLHVLARILRALALVLASHLARVAPVRVISVANTALVWHDGRALATCESGPPIRVLLPQLDTVGWFDGACVPEGEPRSNEPAIGQDDRFLGWMKQWTTAHPRVDPGTDEMILYHSIPLPPYLLYSVLPAEGVGTPDHKNTLSQTAKEGVTHVETVQHTQPSTPTSAPIAHHEEHVRRSAANSSAIYHRDPTGSRTVASHPISNTKQLHEDPSRHTRPRQRILGAPVPGLHGASLAHDFAATRTHTVLMDLPLRLAPARVMLGDPALRFDGGAHARFGVFPRHAPGEARWIADAAGGACCIFHVASAWDERGSTHNDDLYSTRVHLLACRLDSAALVYSAGNLFPPPSAHARPEGGRCELFHWRLDPSTQTADQRFALSAIPFEFPCVRADARVGDSAAPEWVYGCTLRRGHAFDAGLGRTARVDALAKIGARVLVAEGIARGLDGHAAGVCVVDPRGVEDVLESQREGDAVRVFAMPHGWCAQEPAFVPRSSVADDGYLLFYAFNEAQLDPATGAALHGAVSELWVLDARGMRDVVCRVRLPSRVPYGLHGEWFPEERVRGQRAVTRVRTLEECVPVEEWGVAQRFGRWIEALVG